MRIWFQGLMCLTVGVLGTTARADDVQWRPAAPHPATVIAPVMASAPDRAPAASLERPRAMPGQAATSQAAPVASLGRPMPMAPAQRANGIADRQAPLTLAGYSNSALSIARPVVRGKSEELHQPMPIGPGTVDIASSEEPAPRHRSRAASKENDTSEPIPAPKPVGPDLGEKTLLVPEAGEGMMPLTEGEGNGLGCEGDFCPSVACGDGPCGPPGCWWVSPEYLLWWIKNDRVPALVTTSPPGTPRSMAGVLGAPGTTVLLGGTGLDHEEFSGGRLNAGFWFNQDHTIGLEASAFYLAQRSTTFGASSPGTPILARPFFNVSTGMEDSELVAFPDVLAGSIMVQSTSRLWGANADLLYNLCCGCNYRVDALGGFRYLEVDESLRINENLMVTTPGETSGSTILVMDHFGTRNSFYGGELGLEGEYRWNRWFINGRGKVALGTVHEVVSIDGMTAFVLPSGATSVQPGGLLALASNSGQFMHNRFAIAPEGDLNVGYQLTSHLRVFVGYTFLYINHVARPGEEIDRSINPTQLASFSGPGVLVGPARPAFAFHDSSYWAQGINVGLEFRY